MEYAILTHMKIHRFIAPLETSGSILTIRDPELVHQMNRVLKLRVGEQVLFGDGAGNELLTTLTTVSKTVVEATILERQINQNESQKHVTLYLAILKKDNFELAIQKAVEIGVSTIVPLITERTVKMGINTERLQIIIKEAAEQSGRGLLPALKEPITFEEVLHELKPETTVFFDLGGVVLDKERATRATSLLIGPEGGFSEAETTQARELGFTAASLGPLTLRGETAAIVGSYRIVHGM